VSGGWRFKVRQISDPHAANLTWHEKWGLFGAVIQPSRMVRISVNYDLMKSAYASGSAVDSETAIMTLLPSTTFTRIAPDKSYHVRVRATVKPVKWLDFAATASDYTAKNDDPMVNHQEHNGDVSLAASVHPNEQLSMDFNYAYDSVSSSTNLCYIWTTPDPAGFSPPAGAANVGTCTVANSPTGYGGSASLYMGYGTYNAPLNFFSGSINYAPTKYLHFNGGARLNDVNGTAEMLNPLMAPGALQSHYTTPFADVEYKIAPEWIWHGNWTRSEYAEQGPPGPLPSRNTTGDVLTFGVRYAF
jgi:hypothetical protein